MTSSETPIIRRAVRGRHSARLHDVADRVNGFRIGRISRVTVRGIRPRSTVVQWWAWRDDGRELGLFGRRRDAARAIFEHYRKWDTVRYACGRMAA